MQNRAERTIDILLRAFFKDKLKHDWVCECAVANMVGNKREWSSLLVDKFSDRTWERGDGLRQIESTQYSMAELLSIERAFEGANKGFVDPDSFLGLSAVFDCLMNDVDAAYFASRPAFKITNQVELIEEMV